MSYAKVTKMHLGGVMAWECRVFIFLFDLDTIDFGNSCDLSSGSGGS